MALIYIVEDDNDIAQYEMWGMRLNEKTNSAKHVDCDYYNNTCDDI